MHKVAQKGIFSSQPASHCEHALNCHLDETASTAGQRGRERENGRNAGGRDSRAEGGSALSSMPKQPRGSKACARGTGARERASAELIVTDVIG